MPPRGGAASGSLGRRGAGARLPPADGRPLYLTNNDPVFTLLLCLLLRLIHHTNYNLTSTTMRDINEPNARSRTNR